MTSPVAPTLAQYQWGGLMLSGTENQDIRLLMRISRLRFTAINESGVPFLTEVLKLSKTYPSIRNALLALAGRFKATTFLGRNSGTAGDQGTAALEIYQDVLISLREKIAQLDSVQANHDGVALEVMGSILLLTITRFPKDTRLEQSDDWWFHMAGMISVIQSMDRRALESTNLGRLVMQMAAHLDIGALSLGRSLGSTPPEPDFTPIEVIVGYPMSLLTIIATISAVLEDTKAIGPGTSLHALIKSLYDEAVNGRGVGASGHALGHSATNSATGGSYTELLSMLESVLTLWQPPVVPNRISMSVAMALTSAWDIMRKAALLYLWRGGFCASVFEPLPFNRQQVASRFIHEMVLGFRTLLDLAEGQAITIMNIMTWSIVVVGNECGNNADMQTEIVLLLERMQSYFGIEHLKQLISLLRELWMRFESHKHDPSPPHSSHEDLNLDNLSIEFGLCLPLL
ncbi:hypothetical protein FSARC_515 [Fusarium sarcochroum]|uniref:Uncharacterized protein n=1 Tax=Fusarium sarcochroum TaxID=1208366 RepID=A0A8H4XGC1_9HYPO|nr:hypothetical protein FSARC_515 [Fusarium sarcochroum]